MANIHVNGNSNPRVSTGNTTMPKYVGARAEVTRTSSGVRIWLSDYKGETGDSGVYIGVDEPTDPNINVWINPNGGPDE